VKVGSEWAACGLWWAALAGVGWAGTFEADWKGEPDRVWIGEDFWADPMADWSLRGGRAVCQGSGTGGERWSRLGLLTRRIGEGPGTVSGEFGFGFTDDGAGGEVGWRLGDEDLVLALPGKGGSYRFEVRVEPDGAMNRITVRIRDGAGVVVVEKSDAVAGSRLAGAVGVLARTRGDRGAVWLESLALEGTRVEVVPEGGVGPVAGAVHTLSRGVLKVTAQLVPLGDEDPDRVYLEREGGDGWETIGESGIERPGWTAGFRVPEWDAGRDWPYRIVYGEQAWSGTIRKDPVAGEELKVAVLADSGGWDREEAGPFGTAAATGVEVVRGQRPDLVFFPGGQVRPTEGGEQGDAAELEYVQSWCEWHVAHASLTRDVPCVVLPGEADLFQRGLWGEAGRPTLSEPYGGYRQPAEFLRMVFRTQAGHLPDPADAEPVRQGIPVCFGDMVYGRVSFAILEDRKWKSGLLALELPKRREGREEWIPEGGMDPRQLDLPGLKLLGERQTRFLERWAGDWAGADCKLVLSEAMFAQMGTHHGVPGVPVGSDLGSNGWPQSGRKEALDLWRRAGAVHLCADRGLASVVRHGIEGHDDAGPAFAAPSLHPRETWEWRPRTSGLGREATEPWWKGPHFDGWRNPLTVLAVGRPDAAGRMERGFGLVRLRRDTGAAILEAWTEDRETGEWGMMEGWPVALAEDDEGGPGTRSWLPPLQVSGMARAVVEVRSVAEDRLVFARRLRGTTFTPWVPEPGRYDVRIGDPDTGTWVELKGIEAAAEPYRDARVIEF
jgi:hypothetical protein